MIKKTTDGPLRRVRIIDGFDMFIILVAVVAIVINYTSRLKTNPNRLSGLGGYMTRGRIEKRISELSGVRSVELDFYEQYGQYSVSAVLTPWSGNYDMYTQDSREKIYSIIMEETGVQENYITLYDSSTGMKLGKDSADDMDGDGAGRSHDIYNMLERLIGI